MAAAEELHTELAYLAIPRYVRRRVDAKQLEQARAFIEKSASNMRRCSLDPEGNLAPARGLPHDRPAPGLPPLQLPAPVLPPGRALPPSFRPRAGATASRLAS